MVSNEGYYESELDYNSDDKAKNVKVWKIELKETREKPYSYEEALDIAGNGWYNIGLLATLCLAMEGMSLDIFGFSVVVTGAYCDFSLQHFQKTLLLAVPFIGPIVMAYFWGYFSDTKGRKKCLVVALWGSFAATIVGSFSPNWIVLFVSKLIGTCFSSCIQSVPFTLLGESCCARVRAGYIIILSAVNMFCIIVYIGFGYIILNLDFSYNMVFISFTPWRLLAIVQGLPLAISAILMVFYHESPKFLVNLGKEELALVKLRDIWIRNGGDENMYPVAKLFPHEVGRLDTNSTFVQSLWSQVSPIFQKSHLWQTLKLFYLTAAIYFTNSSLFMWFPFLFKEFAAVKLHYSTHKDQLLNMCGLIAHAQNKEEYNEACLSTIDFEMFIISVIQGVLFTAVNIGVSKMADSRKTLSIIFLFTSAMCSVTAVVVDNLLVSMVLFVGTLLSSLCIGIVFSYFVALYPTSYRSMVSCLAVMVARGSGWLGVNLVGTFIQTHCSATFFGLAGYLLSAVVIACFLPSKRSIKKTNL